MRCIVITVAGLTLGIGPVNVSAQGGPPGEEPRALIEREVRQRFAQVVRRELALDDETMRRLRLTAQRFEGRRRELMRQEAETRRALRWQLSEEVPDAARVERLLDDLVALQKRRIAVHEDEARELRAFLSPVQRARYYALQEQLRRRVEEMQVRRLGRPPRGAPPPRGGPPTE